MSPSGRPHSRNGKLPVYSVARGAGHRRGDRAAGHALGCDAGYLAGGLLSRSAWPRPAGEEPVAPVRGMTSFDVVDPRVLGSRRKAGKPRGSGQGAEERAARPLQGYLRDWQNRLRTPHGPVTRSVKRARNGRFGTARDHYAKSRRRRPKSSCAQLRSRTDNPVSAKLGMAKHRASRPCPGIARCTGDRLPTRGNSIDACADVAISAGRHGSHCRRRFCDHWALVASRKEMDVVGFLWLGIITGVGGGTVRDLLLGVPVFCMREPIYVVTSVAMSVAVYFTAHLAQSRFKVLLWLDAVGLAMVTVAGTAKGLDAGAGHHPAEGNLCDGFLGGSPCLCRVNQLRIGSALRSSPRIRCCVRRARLGVDLWLVAADLLPFSAWGASQQLSSLVSAPVVRPAASCLIYARGHLSACRLRRALRRKIIKAGDQI